MMMMMVVVVIMIIIIMKVRWVEHIASLQVQSFILTT
jgi:hypothetical protein